MPRTREGELVAERYRIEGSDGEGWTATDLTSGKRVHVAFVPRAALPGAKRAMELRNVHVVRVLDVGETPEGAVWIVRQNLATDSLTKHLSRHGAMTVHDAIECALAVCDAIAEANVLNLGHGALDASNVYLGWSASGLVDVQVAGIGTSCPAQPRDDVRSILKLIDAMLGGRTPAELKARASSALRVLDLADALVPFSLDRDFAGDRVAARRTRSSTSASVFAEGGYPQTLPELEPALKAVPPKPEPKKPEPEKPEPKKAAPLETPLPVSVVVKQDIARDLPTIVGRRPVFVSPRRRLVRALGIAAAALTVALLVLIGTEGARVMHSRAPHVTTVQAIEAPIAAPIAPPVMASVQEPEVVVPIMRPADLPPAKPSSRRAKR